MSQGHASRKEYFIIFALLGALTALEIGVVYAPLAKGLLVSALIGLALTKAALVALFFMHLKSETRVLKVGVLIPMATPAVYALLLIADSAWRRLT